jgi:hypothetical protein
MAGAFDAVMKQNMQETTGTAEELLVSDEGLCFMELVRYVYMPVICLCA